MTQSIHPRLREDLKPDCCPEKSSQHRSPSGVVPAKIGIGNQTSRSIMMIFQSQVNDCWQGVFDITGAAEAPSNYRLVCCQTRQILFRSFFFSKYSYDFGDGIPK